MRKTGIFSRKNIKLIIFFAVTLITCSGIIITMFSGLIRRYENTTAYESAGHLIEISSQIKLNIEHTICSDRNLSRTLASSIEHHAFGSENELLSYLHQMRQIWGTSSIHVYNYAGLCIDESGAVRNQENGAATAYSTVKNGESFNIEQAYAEYASAVSSPLLLRGSRIAAVSAVRDLDTMIENMDIRSFDGKSTVYLTRQNGIRISQTQKEGVKKVFNISALFTGGKLRSISEKNSTLEKAMNTKSRTVFIYNERGNSEYVVLTPVNAGRETWFLFFIVPHSVVNKTMYSYSSYMTLFMILSTVFMCLVLLVFALIYQHRNEQYTEDLRVKDNDLRRALVLADSANKAKTVFLSNMSHDIRTPMNAIINMTQFTIDNYDNREKAMGYLKVIQKSSDHLLKLINDVLDMSRIESGKMSFADDPFSMKNTIDAICAIIRPLCDGKKQIFTCDYSSFIHDNLRGDAVRLTRILINILNNAVKFTPENGTVSFRITELSSLSGVSASFRFEIQDSGIGISQDDLSRIFEPFTRAETSAVRRTEGSGLGLSISKLRNEMVLYAVAYY
jgi:signal transduction histidine kinase